MKWIRLTSATRRRKRRNRLFRLRFQIGIGQADGLKRYRELRKDRARMLGVLRERELDPEKAKAAEAAAKAAKKSSGKKKGK